MATNNSINAPIPFMPSKGGTGVANSDANTITLGGSINTVAAFSTAGTGTLTLRTTNTTDVTFPVTGTLLAAPGSTSITTVGTITTGTWNGTVISAAFGGTGLSSGTSGGVLYFNSTSTIASSGALTANQIVLGGGASGPTVLGSLGTVNTVLHGNAGGVPSFSAVSLTADVSGVLPATSGGTGVNNGSNTITLGGNINTVAAFSTTGSGALTFNTSGTTVATIPSGTVTLATTAQVIAWSATAVDVNPMVVNNGYITTSATLVTLTLPATAAVGTLFYIVGQGTGGWKIAPQSSPAQIIHLGNTHTTAGSGSLASSDPNDCVTLVCTVANTEFSVISSVGGSFVIT